MSVPDQLPAGFAATPFAAPSDAIFGHARKRSLSKPKPIEQDRPPVSIQTSPAQRTPPKASSSASRPREVPRPDSPDVETILAKTPKPRRRSSTTFSSPAHHLRSRSHSTLATESTKSSHSSGKGKANESLDDVSDYGVLIHQESLPEEDAEEEEDGSESDSSIDIHTPLPHLMFRDGLLSPRSKLLPPGSSPQGPYPFLFDNDDPSEVDRARSALSIVSNATIGSMMTKSGYWKDPRDTERRRVRHRDGQLLRAGMGLTTGLGWSDSEDEDAPSTLTRRLISTSIAKGAPTAVSRTPSQALRDSVVAGLSRSPPPPRSPRNTSTTAFSRSASASLSSLRSAPSPKALTPGPRIPRARTQSSATRSTLSTSTSTSTLSVASTLDAGSSTASQSSSTSTGSVPRPLRLPQAAHLRPRLKRSVTGASVRSIHSLIEPGARAPPEHPEHHRARTLSNPSVLFARGPATVSSGLSWTGSSGSLGPPAHRPTASPAAQGRGIAKLSPAPAQTGPAPSGMRSPASPTRPRPLVGGPRPKPRTGTGMAYHSSAAYSAKQAEPRLRSISMASTAPYGRF